MELLHAVAQLLGLARLQVETLQRILRRTLAAAADLRPFERMDVFDLQWVSDPQISPDGKRVVYVRNSMDIMTDQRTSRLWLINSCNFGQRSWRTLHSTTL